MWRKKSEGWFAMDSNEEEKKQLILSQTQQFLGEHSRPMTFFYISTNENYRYGFEFECNHIFLII